LEKKVEEKDKKQAPTDFHNVVGQDSLTRFDKKKKQNPNYNNKPQNQNQNQNRPQIPKPVGNVSEIAKPILNPGNASVAHNENNRPNHNHNRKKKYRKPNGDRKNETNNQN